MPAGLTIHTNRTLYDSWNERYKDIKDRIDELKVKQKAETDPDSLNAIEGEIQELFIQANLIHQFLADVGIMARIDEKKLEKRYS
ncbi:putative nucleic acid-binding Zn-ribbon protein [Rossellomorea marisflavi]